MVTYCWKCRTCGMGTTSPRRHVAPEHNCPDGVADVRRDYATENVGIGSGVRESRVEMTTSGYRDLFLPTADDFADQSDPSGQKGLRKWADEHAPKEDNKRPAWPVMEKTQF